MGWTRIAEATVGATGLANATPKDAKNFCPAYAGLNPERRKIFWAGLLSAMARPESNFKPEATYVEPDILDANKQNVVSRGLRSACHG